MVDVDDGVARSYQHRANWLRYLDARFRDRRDPRPPRLETTRRKLWHSGHVLGQDALYVAPASLVLRILDVLAARVPERVGGGRARILAQLLSGGR